MCETRNSSLLGKITVLVIICCCSLSAQAKYGGGMGGPNDPYLIYTAEQMNEIGLNEEDWGSHFKLMADIDLGQFTGEEYNIIGSHPHSPDYGRCFTGVFDGNGHTISNFTHTSPGKRYIGLFGYIEGSNAEVKNLGLIDPYLDAGTGDYVGSLVGWLEVGTISNCYVEGGSVSGHRSVGGLVGRNHYVTITNCYSTSSVSGTGWSVGGLVGFIHKGSITNCYSTGSVAGTGGKVGGLVGSNCWYSTITNSYSTGSVSGDRSVGGLVGWNDHSIISNCYSNGSVLGNDDVGGLVGLNGDGTITNCRATGGVTGENNVGGLVGYNHIGTITGCYSSAAVYGNDWVGGLVGENDRGTITGCYATGNVTGYIWVGGLAGENLRGEITNCYAKGETINGYYSIGGLVGDNWIGTITNCYSTGSVEGVENVGGLVGTNGGTISNCCSTGSVAGDNFVGGLVGRNGDCYETWCYPGIITNCYSAGSVVGSEKVGGLVGFNYEGIVTASFWDIETSGQTNSDGGNGKTTAEMQTQSTFTDAGWDFVGETVNGIEDIWFIPQQDYPHLWWEGMQVPMELKPRTLNCRSKGNWVKAHITLPEGFTVADVDSDRPAVLHSFGFESAPLHVFVNKDKLVEIEAAFEREAVCSLAGDWPQMLTVAGFLTDGSIFLGTSTLRMITPGMK